MAKKEEEVTQVVDFAEPIVASIKTLNGEIEKLESQLASMEEIHMALREKRKQVAVLERTIAQLSGKPATKNRPRGANREDIMGHLVKHGGATVREISEATGINIPSVRYTLGHNDVFERDEANNWTVVGC